MIKMDIDQLMKELELARLRGCKKVKLQLYSNWDAVVKEQKNPSHPKEDYQVDTRFYNTVEFETHIENQVATDKLVTREEGNTFILKVALSDQESLLRALGINELF